MKNSKIKPILLNFTSEDELKLLLQIKEAAKINVRGNTTLEIINRLKNSFI